MFNMLKGILQFEKVKMTQITQSNILKKKLIKPLNLVL